MFFRTYGSSMPTSAKIICQSALPTTSVSRSPPSVSYALRVIAHAPPVAPSQPLPSGAGRLPSCHARMKLGMTFRSGVEKSTERIVSLASHRPRAARGAEPAVAVGSRPLAIVPRAHEAGHDVLVTEIAPKRRIGRKELDHRIALHQVQRLVRPVRARHVEIGVDEREVVAVGRQPADDDVLQIFLVPHLVPRAELYVERIRTVGYLESPVAKRKLDGVQHNAGRAHVVFEGAVVHVPGAEPIRVEYRGDDVQWLRYGLDMGRYVRCVHCFQFLSFCKDG